MKALIPVLFGAALLLNAQKVPTKDLQTFADAAALTPGTFHKITPATLPKPFATPSALNFGRVVKRPDGAWPKAPAGFKVELFATDLKSPRKIITAPNGDFF